MAKKRNGRQDAIRDIVRNKDVRTQRVLVDELRAMGFDCTQATVSRDIADMGLRKLPEGIYVLAEDLHLQRMVSELVTGVLRTDNLVMIKAQPGTASGIAAAVDAGEEAIDAAAKTGVNGALDGAKAAIDKVAKDAVDETADEELVDDAVGALPAEVTVKERASTGDKPTGEQLNQYTLKDYKIDGVIYTVSDPADWNTLTAGTDDTYVGTATVTMTAGKATATKEIKVSFVATDYKNVKTAAEAIGTEVRVEVKESEISSGVDTAIKTALEAKCKGVKITAVVNGTASGSEGDILYKTAEITIADETVSATSYEVTIDVTIDVTAD